MLKPIYFLCGAFLLLPFLSPHRTAADVIEQHQYLRTHGAEVAIMYWQRLAGEPERIITKIGTETDQTLMEETLATHIWQVLDRQKLTDLRIERQGNELALNGTFKRETIERSIRIDEAPWFQTMSISFRPFLDSADQQIKFWVVRPDTLGVHKLRAEKKGIEELTVQGQQVRAQKLELRLSGLAAPFWKADYWFREGDHLFLRYQGSGGLPGSPDIHVELSSPLLAEHGVRRKAGPDTVVEPANN